ncbi:MAG TPA: LamG domain-containing protein, partial [Verrucomicrobiae bacterium]|nr:LamG domain-containing protein [Verrucomicrobiae bacterium]
MKGRTNHSVGRILLGAKRAAAICAARIGKGYARAGEKYRVVFPDGRYRTWISRIAFHGTAAALILALIIPIQSLDILAAGVYTSSATDADGNTFLAHNTVNDTAYYDTTQDSSPEVQRQLGVDPNWPNGVTRKSSALKFDGTDDRIDFGNIGIHNIGTGSMSWSLWFKAAPSTDGVLLRKSGANNLNGVLIQVLNVSGQVQARLGDSTGSATIALLSGAGYNDGAWHHLALTFDRSSSAILYIDNAVVTSSSSRPLIGVNMVPSATLTMAANSTYGSPLNGVLDDPRIYSRVLTAEEISQLFSRNGISEAGLVGQWKFDESSCEGASPCYVRDTSPYGNSGTLLDNGSNGDGATTGPLFVSGANSIVDGFKGCGPEDVGCVNPSGRSGAGNVSVTADTSTASDSAYEVQVTNSPAVQFDGTDDYVSLPTVTGATHAALSYSFWFSTTNISPSGGAVLFRSRNSTSTEVTLLAGKIRFQHGFSTTGGVFETAAIISTNTWYHVVVAYNNSSVSNVPSIFINGDPVAVTVATAPVGTASVNWGNSGMSMGGGAATMYLAGKIDDARVFSRVLTAAEAKALYVGNPVSNLSILGWWKMDEGTGTSAEDATGNGVTGTLTNGPTWVEGYSSAGAVSAGDPSDSPVWAMPGYQFREQVKVANASGSTLPTGYSVNAPTSRATKLNANQTRADGNDWRMVHQPTDATRSLSFDGSNDDVTIPYSSLVDFDYNNPFTVSVWMKAGATQANTGLTYNYIAQRRLGAAGSQSFYLAINNQGAAIPGTIRAGR